jgi:hypothetical protein
LPHSSVLHFPHIELLPYILEVILPAGVHPGQKIEVRAPNGSRTVDTIIPSGLRPGQAFLVKFPAMSKEAVLNAKGSAGEQGREEIESERGAGQDQNTVDEVNQSPSFVQVLDNFLTPKPDPDVIEAMEKARRNAEETTTKSSPRPTPEHGNGVAPRTRTAAHSRHAPATPESAAAPNSDGEGSQPHALKSIPSVASSHINHVEGEALEASVTRVNAEPILDTVPSTGATKTTEEVQGGELYATSSFIKTLEDFFTPKPYVFPSQTSSTHQPSEQDNSAPNQKLILVQVPSELLPGSTIYVEIPGENRTVAAQVPSGVKSFHVAYIPQIAAPVAAAPPMLARADMVPKQRQVGKEKLLSVRVPSGTLPGTTLHISVPDEPGRILAAQVPPGSVNKFHVSYVPREQPAAPFSGGGMLPPASPYHY